MSAHGDDSASHSASGSASGVEVEVKYVGVNLDDVRGRLANAGAIMASPRSLERNTVFDDALGVLQQSGRLLRLRDERELTAKLPLEDARFKSRREITLTIARGDAAALLAGIGFKPVWSYEKYREGWDLEGMWVTLDELPFIGTVVEVEGDRQRIEDTAARLGLPEAARSTATYRDLYDEFIARTGAIAGDMTFAAESA